MNAKELADIVDKWAYKESAEYLTDAANMLRQQADKLKKYELRNQEQIKRIAELEEANGRLVDLVQLLREEVNKLRQSAEPVAWMEIEYGGFTEYKVWREPVSSKSIPLYTTPQIKELSDEEIETIGRQYLTEHEDGMYEFARAILTKASEK